MEAQQVAEKSVGAGWEAISSRMRVVRLTPLIQALVPALILPSLSRSTRGATFYSGRGAMGLGLFMVASSVIIGFLLAGPTEIVGAVIVFWLVGTAGTVTIVGAVRPTAFVKPICVRCRLLPIIKEHESIHISGVADEKSVWASMRTRHSVKSLSLEGDPSICWFCPIPKRLSEH